MYMRIPKIVTLRCIKSFFARGHTRTLKAKKQVLLSYVYQGADVLLGFWLIRLVLDYLDVEKYGIWLVLFSFTAWLNLMDVGIAQGLRNKFAESIAKQQIEKAKYYVSTAYAIIIFISTVFFVLFLCVNHFIDWTRILNASPSLKDDLDLLALFVFGSFSLTFVLKIITTLLVADQRPSILYLKNLIEKILKVILVFALICTTEGSLLSLGIAYSLIPIVVLLGITFYYFARDFKNVRPAWEYVSMRYLDDLIGLGWKFFVIQIAVVVLFATDNIIITQLLGPEHITPYEISKKYFSIPLMLFIVLVQPLWSAVTDAFYKDDYAWIRRSERRLIKIYGSFVVLTVAMLLLSNKIYSVWLADSVQIPFRLSVLWAVFTMVMMVSSMYTNIINGLGKVTISLVTATFNLLINIPLSLLLGGYLGLGSSGVLLATIFCVFISCCLRIIQFKLIINQQAKGIWAK